MDTPVLIVGGGPAGLTLAIDLGQRGIRCTVIDKLERHGPHPKLERANARTMEIFRRLGIADRVRAAGLPAHIPMDVFIVLDMARPPVLRLPYGSVQQLKAEVAARNDGMLPLEPYQLISQYTLDPLLREIAEHTPNVTVRFGCELLDFTQDAAGVSARVQAAGGKVETLRAAYLVGCDGGQSTVRKQLGIGLEGRGQIRRMRAALFRCDDLFERIPIGKGRHYHIIADQEFTSITVQDSMRHFRMNKQMKEGEDLAATFKRAVGFPIEVETLYTGDWSHHLLCADHYGEGRVFIAGDAAHLVIPTGGLGMNTAVGDVHDLAWKLAGMLQGWGGPRLLASYLSERHQIGVRNVRASGSAVQGRVGWRGAWQPNIADDTPAGAATRAEVARIANVEQRKTNEILGIECGYRYIDTPLIWHEPGDAPDPDNRAYVPTTWPGARLPHAWLDDGSAVADRLGRGYTLLKLGRNPADTGALETAMRATGAPFEVQRYADAAARAIYGYDLLLIRPDLHVVWRGNAPPDAPRDLAAVATGHVSPEQVARMFPWRPPAEAPGAWIAKLDDPI